METCFLPLKIFRGRLGERLEVTIVGTPKGNLRSQRDDFASPRRIFPGRLRFPPNFAPFWGAVAPPFMKIHDGNSQVISGGPVCVEWR